MKIRALTTLLLSLAGLVGMMGGTSSAKGGTVGVITVKRAITLSIQNLGPDTSRYFGVVTHSPATIDIVARARIRKKQSQASLSRRTRGTIKKAPEKKQNNAKAQVQEFCNQATRSSQNPVRVTHVPASPAMPFQIGQSQVDQFFAYSVTGVRAPRNDVIRADQSGKDVTNGNTVVQTGPWEWKGNCGPALQALTLMP